MAGEVIAYLPRETENLSSGKENIFLGIGTGTATRPGTVTGVTGVRARVQILAFETYPYPSHGWPGVTGA